MKNGPYEMVIAPEDYPGKKYRDRYCYEHTLVWWENTGVIPESDEIIHHKNGNKRDNPFSNLELKKKKIHDSYHRRNMSDETKHKLSNSQKGSNNSQSKLTKELVLQIRERYDNGDKINDIASDFNIHRVTVTGIGKRESWKHI